MGEMAFHGYQFARSNQFIGIRNTAPIDAEHSSGLKRVGFHGDINLGVDTLHLLDQGVLHQPVV